MTKVQFITDKARQKEWNRVVNHPLQTWEWGNVKQAAGNRVLRAALLNDKDQIQSGYLFTVHQSPLGLIINYAKGPWVPTPVLAYLAKYAAPNLLLIKLEPEVWLDEAGKFQLPIQKKVWQENGLLFYRSASPVFARHTFIIDLSFNENKLLSLMKSKTRYNINLAKRKGVTVVDESNNREGFNIFFKLYLETISRQNYLGHSREYHKMVWQIMKQADIARILVASYQNQPLAAYLLFFYKDRGYYLYGGSSEKYKEVMASNLLMWEAIKLAKKLGMKYFDLWGALEKNYPPGHPWAGFHRFKEGYGGIHQSYLPTLDVVCRPFNYTLFSWAWPLRTKVLELISSRRSF